MSIRIVEKKDFLPTGTALLQPAESVLDVGCGIMPQGYIRPSVHICAEPFSQYMDELKKKVDDAFDRTYVFLQSDWAQTVQILPSKSVDTVMLLDVIEHLEKNESLRLLKETERIAKKQIVVFTTLGFVPQHHGDGKDAWGLSGGVWQEHKSGWQPSDLGDAWEVVVCERYHETDNLGKPFEKPYGAIWAVKNFPSKTESPWIIERRKFLNRIYDAHSYKSLQIATIFVSLLIKLYNGGLRILRINSKK